MPGDARGLRVIHLFWALLLALPPAARLIQDALRRPETGSYPQTLAGRDSAVVLEQRLREAEADLKALNVPLQRQRYGRVLGEVLPMNDPAAARSSLFVALRSFASMRDDVAVVSATHSLVGRAIDVFSSARAWATPEEGEAVGPISSDDGRRFALARVQTVLDPAFRVRFSSGGARGVLYGTGETTSDGAPLLRTHLLQGADRLEPGDRVVTDRGDELYPGGIAIGTVVDGQALGQLKVRHRTFLVRADVNFSGPLDRVVFLPNLLRLSFLESRERRATP